MPRGREPTPEDSIKEWMTDTVVTVRARATLSEAHRLMKTKDVRRLFVLERGRLVGILTRGDIERTRDLQDGSLRSWIVSQAMTADPLTIDQDATMRAASCVMLKRRFSGLPVINRAGQAVGTIELSWGIANALCHTRRVNAPGRGDMARRTERPPAGPRKARKNCLDRRVGRVRGRSNRRKHSPTPA
jgi:acetoin utilization protein AcuB